MEIRAEKLETLNTTAEKKEADIWAWLIFAGAVIGAIGALGKAIS